jgi:hypothetical protein
MDIKTSQIMDAGTKSDRTIIMTCTPVLTYPSPGNYSATLTWTQTGGDPNSMNGRVDANGNIRLTNMPNNANYNDNVDITINLDTSRLVDENGNPVTGRFATSTEYSGTGPVTGYAWFCGIDANGNYNLDAPITIDGMSATRESDTQVLINDDTADNGPSYAFCLGLVLTSLSNSPYYITLDPTITTKSTRTTSFMLKD